MPLHAAPAETSAATKAEVEQATGAGEVVPTENPATEIQALAGMETEAPAGNTLVSSVPPNKEMPATTEVPSQSPEASQPVAGVETKAPAGNMPVPSASPAGEMPDVTGTPPPSAAVAPDIASQNVCVCFVLVR